MARCRCRVRVGCVGSNQPSGELSPVGRVVVVVVVAGDSDVSTIRLAKSTNANGSPGSLEPPSDGTNTAIGSPSTSNRTNPIAPSSAVDERREREHDLGGRAALLVVRQSIEHRRVEHDGRCGTLEQDLLRSGPHVPNCAAHRRRCRSTGDSSWLITLLIGTGGEQLAADRLHLIGESDRVEDLDRRRVRGDRPWWC